MTELAPGAVTTADLYRELVGMRGDLSKILMHQERIDVRNEAADRLHADHEVRIRALEVAKWKLAGACIALSAVGGGGAAWIALALSHH